MCRTDHEQRAAVTAVSVLRLRNRFRVSGAVGLYLFANPIALIGGGRAAIFLLAGATIRSAHRMPGPCRVADFPSSNGVNNRVAWVDIFSKSVPSYFAYVVSRRSV